MDILYFFHIHFTSFHIQIFPKYPSICNLYVIVLNNSSKYISTILRTFGSWYFTQRLSISQASFLSKDFPRIHHVLRIFSVVEQLCDFLWKKNFCEVLLAIDCYVSTESCRSRVTFRVDHTQYREFVSGLLNIMAF